MIAAAFILIGVLILLFYYYAIRPMSYWKKRGVVQGEPGWLWGDQSKQMFGKESIADMYCRAYNQNPGARYCGVYQFTTPALLIKDAQLLRRIAIKDFDYFMNHKPLIPDGADPLWNNNIFALKDQRWKDVRHVLTPAFTSSKMKMMFLFMAECAENFVNHFLTTYKGQDVIDVTMKDITSRFSNDVIASTAFGLHTDSLKDVNNEFYIRCKDITNFATPWRKFKIFGFQSIPSIFKLFGIKFFDRVSSSFFMDIVKRSIKMREQENFLRQDMLHLLLEARKEVDVKRKQGSLIGDITDEDITAHAMIFFLAGLESVSTLLTFMSYELSIQPDIQTRLRDEINNSIEECDGKLTYDALMKMKYLDMVISETMRKWPNFPEAHRVCTKEYVIEPELPGEKRLVIEKGTAILLPIFPIHYDPKYFPDPNRFDPERFSDENKGNIDPSTYMPFGLGPRVCVGARFAVLEAKVFFSHILPVFEIVPNAKTKIPVKLANENFNIHAEDGIQLGLKVLNK